MHRRPLSFFLTLLCCISIQGSSKRGWAKSTVALPAELVANESTTSTPTAFEPRGVRTWQEAQIALARLGFSSGAIDGIPGAQSEAALRVFQATQKLPITGQLDQGTRDRLLLSSPPLEELTLTVAEFASFGPLSATWLGKSMQAGLDYESALEWAAERSHAQPALIRTLNPEVDWSHVLPGARIIVPAVGRRSFAERAVQLHVQLSARIIRAYDAEGEVIAQFPVSIARNLEKRPVGELRVTVVIPNPDYTFDPAVFPESDEGRELGRKLRLPPGPNNPVGLAWIGLDRPGYGIHGTPTPEKVGRTESHGCFRLANWDAVTLIDLAWVGLPVVVEP